MILNTQNTPTFLLMMLKMKNLEIIPNIIKDIRNKKINDFETVFRIAIDHTYEMKDLLLIRQFLFKAIEEVNNELIENNKPCRVDFGYDAGTHFLNETKTYWEKKKFYNNNGALDHFKLGRHTVISGYTNDDELILFLEELKLT